MDSDNGCVNCGETDVPLDDKGWCEHCFIELKRQEYREKQQEYADRLTTEKYRDRYKQGE